MKIKSFLLGLVVFFSSFHLLYGASSKECPIKDKSWLPVVSICTKHNLTKEEFSPGSYKYFSEIEGSHASEEEIKKIITCDNQNDSGWKTISIKRRGNSSDGFMKKQYTIVFPDAEGENKKVSLGGLPEGEKWVLQGPFVDKSLLRNLLSYDLGRKLGESRGERYFSPRTKSVELFLNGSYNGLYIIIDKIERGDNRVHIKKIAKQAGSEIQFLAELSANDGELKTAYNTYIRYRYPSEKKMKTIARENQDQARHIQSSIDACIARLEMIFSKPNLISNTIKNKKQTIFDVNSFIDFIILQEVTKNVDGYRRSAYFHRKKNGQIAMGPIWDFDLSLGNLNFSPYGMQNEEGWLYRKRHSLMKHAFWFKKLIKNKDFREKLQTRYRELRMPGALLSYEKIDESINNHEASLRGSGLRDFERWKNKKTVTQEIFMTTKAKGNAHDEHVNILKTWLKNRLKWIDENIEFIQLGRKDR